MLLIMITRPLLRYHGGKYLLAPWIISHFPKHRIYTESFGGAGSVLLQKDPCYCEVYNDLDNEVVNLFTICRTQGIELIESLHLTPFSRKEFELSYEKSEDNFEQARRTIIRSFMGFGSAAASGRKTGFRSNSNRSGTTPAQDWKNYPEALHFIIERLRGVVIENKDALEIMKAHDTAKTLHYADPPYVLSTRCQGEKTVCYKFEMTDAQHEMLLTGIKKLIGMVLISGYENDLYNDLLPDFIKIKKKSFSDGAMKRIEVLYLSPNIQRQNLLF